MLPKLKIKTKHKNHGKGRSKWRYLFPFLRNNKDLIYLDSAGTSLKPKTVIDSIKEYYNKYSINSHSETSNIILKKNTEVINDVRQLIVDKIEGVSSDEVLFMPSATYALNMLSLSVKKNLQNGDNIFLSYLEHSSNCYPWEAVAKETSSNILFLPLNKKNVVKTDNLMNYINHKTKIVSLVHTSNNLGVINDIQKIAATIKKINSETLIVLDACQSIAHMPITVKKWQIDALVFAPHKLYASTGLGILWVNKEVRKKMTDILWGGGKKISPNEPRESNFPFPSRWEVGSLPLAEIYGLKAALDWLSSLSSKESESMLVYMIYLKNYTFKKLKRIKRIAIYSKYSSRSNIILFNLLNHHPHDVANYLGKHNIILRAGDMCSPYLHKVIGVKFALRISLDIYNNTCDVDNLILRLKEIIEKPIVLIE